MAGSLDMTPGGQVVDFSALEWNATTGKWCDVNGLDGDTFAYAGTTPSASTVAVDTTAHNLRLSLTVSAGQYAGGGVSFDSCVDASSFNAISFSASVTSGSLNGCVWQVQLQTQDQRPSNLTDPTGGTCNPAGANGCYRYPAATLAMPVAATYVVPFTSFNNPASSTIATAMQVVGVQWQANSASGTGTCTVELHIDDVRFVTQ
jgi:hypothetical protein